VKVDDFHAPAAVHWAKGLSVTAPTEFARVLRDLDRRCGGPADPAMRFADLADRYGHRR
jgi:hypothetical protein